MVNPDELGLKTCTLRPEQLTSVLLSLLDVHVPLFLPELPDNLEKYTREADQVILAIIDNFGLFEITTYQPPFLIKSLDNLLLIETDSPERALAGAILKETFFCKQNNRFNLLSYLQEQDKKVLGVAQEEFVSKITNDLDLVAIQESDVNIYVNSVKMINRADFLALHFSDFDAMYNRYRMEPPREIALKIMKRTDKWLSLFYQQALKGTALVVIGNHGKRPINMHLTGRAAEWKRANLPIGLIRIRE